MRPRIEATAEDVNRIFGDESQPGYFEIGEPLDMEGIKIYLNLKRFAERSSGVFGKSGTGKTYLTRMLLAGMIQENVAVNLVFDMHNEYGWEGTRRATQGQGAQATVWQPHGDLYAGRRIVAAARQQDGLRRPASATTRSSRKTWTRCSGILNLSDVQRGALYTLHASWGAIGSPSCWRTKSPEELAESLDQKTLLAGTLGAIQRKLGMFAALWLFAPRPRAKAPWIAC